MCKQRVGDDDFISNKCNSNQPNYQINSLIKDGSLSSNLHVPLLPKNPTISPKNYLSQNNTISSIHEAKLIANIVLPMILTSLLIYSKSMISTIFLGRLGEHALAAGSLALGFANITGYSLFSGLAMGMDPICGQAYGAKNHALLGLTLHKTVLLLLTTSIPVSILWLNMERILILCHQDRSIAALAQSFLIYSLPDLLAQSILHPLRIYLRTQSITKPLTLAAVFSTMVHLPLTWLAVVKLRLGIQGIAVAGVVTNFNMVIFLVMYVMFSEPCKKGWAPVSMESFRGFSKLLRLSIPSCISVCLEWWWYEIMILLTGLLPDPNSTIGSMGVLIQTTSLIYIFPSSLSVGVSTRVGNELGSGRPDRAKRAANTGMFFSFLLGVSAVLFTFMVREKWAQLFTDDVEIIKLTVMVLPVIGLCELGNCPQTTGCGVLRGTARPKVGANINLGCFYLVGMPVAIWLGFVVGLGFQGLWFGLLAAQGSCVVTMLVVLYRTNWEAEAKRAEQLTDYYNCEEENNVQKLDGQLLV
ncbi:protein DETOXIFICATION 49-like [Silene latifolia]|uniref:protein DETOXIFICATION 49-like n=1 Tax=Silene latifolia TaxID=37657 RepID=UPI003D77F9A6